MSAVADLAMALKYWQYVAIEGQVMVLVLAIATEHHGRKQNKEQHEDREDPRGSTGRIKGARK